MAGTKANQTSFKKGDKAALGNDKTMSISEMLKHELNENVGDMSTVSGYDAELTRRRAISKKLIEKALREKESMVFKALFSEIADRTEGKALQRNDVTSDGEKMAVLFVKPEKMTEEE